MSAGLVYNLDPDPETRARISGLLRAGDTDVREFSTAEDCLGAVHQSRPIVVVVAPQVGSESGADVCARLAATSSVQAVLRASLNGGAITVPDTTALVPEPSPEAFLKSVVANLLQLGQARLKSEMLERDSENLRQEFQVCVTRMAHDLTEPIRGIMTFAEMLEIQSTDQLSASEREYLGQVVQSAERSRTLLKYLTSYVQASREPASSHRNVDLRGVVLAAEAQHRAEIEQAGAVLRVEDLPLVRGNPTRLQQLFGCLLSNCLKYRNPDRQLEIVIQATPETGERWRISVTDNGLGLDPQHQESIFAPFHRLHGQEIPGTGMGLALSRRIVEAHGGTIAVKSAPGEGATFSFTVPAAC